MGNSPFDIFEYCKIKGECDGSGCIKLRDKEYAAKRFFPDNCSQSYDSGLRYTADAADCAMPISLDSSSGCSFVCIYCFSNNLARDIIRNPSKKKLIQRTGSMYTQFSHRKLERLLEGKSESAFGKGVFDLVQQGQPIQWGALGDPFDEIERSTGWGLKAIEILKKYKIPTRISTKGADVLLLKNYRKIFEGTDHFWFAFSIITANDDLIEKVDITAPNASRRLEAMKALSSDGHRVTLRLRPFLKGISDSWKGEPEGWKILLNKVKDAGAFGVSFEWMFWESAPTSCQKIYFRMLQKEMRDQRFFLDWRRNSYGRESCLRGSKEFKEELTYKIREYAHDLGMKFCISDPHFKEYSDSDNCCCMDSNDPIWGGYSKKQWATIVVDARKHFEKTGECKKYYYKDWSSAWGETITISKMVTTGGWRDSRKNKYKTWNDQLRNKWNEPLHPRSPYIYFRGVLTPVGLDDNKDVIYQYKPWKNWKQWEEGKLYEQTGVIK